MTYQETLGYLYEVTPMFQQRGAEAYKPGLHATLLLAEAYGHPERAFRTIHVAGTNGKGSVSHALASVLMAAGYKVGLFTSPHLVDFSERIRVDGRPIDRDFVCRWVAEAGGVIEQVAPSFFELTFVMAMDYFRAEGVEVAVIEAGMGGRMDSTNIISPMLSIVTNVSYDHMQFLGSSLAEIASHKAGIMRDGVPLLLGRSTPEVVEVFRREAAKLEKALWWEVAEAPLYQAVSIEEEYNVYEGTPWGRLLLDLPGVQQLENAAVIFRALALLSSELNIDDEAIREGLRELRMRTGLRGRWQRLSLVPKVYIDTAHNKDGIQAIMQQLQRQHYAQLHIVFGMARDKEVSEVLQLLPKEARYYYVQAEGARALPRLELEREAAKLGLEGKAYPSVLEGYEAALATAQAEDLIFVGGSNFVIGDLLKGIEMV